MQKIVLFFDSTIKTTNALNLLLSSMYLKKNIFGYQVSFAVGLVDGFSQTFSHFLDNAQHRHQFVQNVTDFLIEFEFDGLDLIWSSSTKRFVYYLDA